MDAPALPPWLASTWLFRLGYRHLNFSQRLIAPFAWGDRRKLTRDVRRAMEAPFGGDKDALESVLYALARSMTASTPFFRSLWERRAALADKPLLALWGMKDPAFTPRALARLQGAYPSMMTVEVAGAGHWPHEEEPELSSDALRTFLTGG
jgi:haloalkane dehalogenase